MTNATKKALITSAILLILCLLQVTALATVITSEGDAVNASTVYVVGNPDFYPVEYYDTEAKAYKGFMPELLSKISEKSGINFVYILAGTTDMRAYAAKSKEADLISGCIAEKDIYNGTTPSEYIFSLELNGEKVNVCFEFTEISSDTLKNAINEYISSMDAVETIGMAVQTAMAQNTGLYKIDKLTLIVIIALMIILAVFAACLILIFKKKARDEKIDRMTGVDNKKSFIENYQKLMSSSPLSLWYVVYYCFDISHVNSYYGTDEAENILKNAANVLSESLPVQSFFGRVSGGGFAAACQYPSRNKAEEDVNRLISKINEYGKKFGKDYTPKFRAGIYKLKTADTSCEKALYASEQGYHEAIFKMMPYSFAEEQDILSLLETEKLRKQAIPAISAHEFKCYLQYISDPKTDKPIGGEVLSRWLHPEYGVLMPKKYIADMEEDDTIIELDYYMIEETCRLLEELGSEGQNPTCLFCNVSRKTFAQKDFSGNVADIAQRYDFKHEYLCLEITESSMFPNSETAAENILKCKRLGFKIALDDVGSGYSSFADLIRYPVDFVKFDRDLLLCASEEDGKKLLIGLNALFHYIGVKTLCEGIETDEQYKLIKEIDIDLVQGFYIHKPMPIDESIVKLKELC